MKTIESVYVKREVNGYICCIDTYYPEPTHTMSGYETEKIVFQFDNYESKALCRKAAVDCLIESTNKMLDEQDEKMNAKPKDNPVPHKAY